MRNSIRDYQIRVNSLGVLQKAGKPPLIVDNINGSKTIEGISMAKDFLDVLNNAEIFDESGIKRIHWHWTAGSYTVNANVTKHYNMVFDEKGRGFTGHSPESQARYQAGVRGASHTRMANSGALGLSVAGMHGSQVNWGKGLVNQGPYPLTWDAIDGMLKQTAKWCVEYDIYPSKWTTLSHAEVQPTLKIKQNNKWDYQVLPESSKLLDPIVCGDILRERLEKFL